MAEEVRCLRWYGGGMRVVKIKKKVTFTDANSKSNFIKIGKSTVLIKSGVIVIRSGLIIHQ